MNGRGGSAGFSAKVLTPPPHGNGPPPPPCRRGLGKGIASLHCLPGCVARGRVHDLVSSVPALGGSLSAPRIACSEVSSVIKAGEEGKSIGGGRKEGRRVGGRECGGGL